MRVITINDEELARWREVVERIRELERFLDDPDTTWQDIASLDSDISRLYEELGRSLTDVLVREALLWDNRLFDWAVRRTARQLFESSGQKAEGDMLCMGYLRLDRPGDLDETPCIECDQPCWTVWYALMQNAETGETTFRGPLCPICATSD